MLNELKGTLKDIKKLVEIPLQLQMLADIYLVDLFDNTAIENNKLIDKSIKNINDLYTKFAKQKHKIFSLRIV